MPPYGKFFAMFTQTKKAPLCKGGWRDSACGIVKVWSLQNAKDSLYQVQPLRLVSLGTSPYTGEAPECAAGMQNKIS